MASGPIVLASPARAQVRPLAPGSGVPGTQRRGLGWGPSGLAAVNPANPQSWTAYAYVANQPLTATDPLGLMTISIGFGGGPCDMFAGPCDGGFGGPGPCDVTGWNPWPAPGCAGGGIGGGIGVSIIGFGGGSGGGGVSVGTPSGPASGTPSPCTAPLCSALISPKTIGRFINFFPDLLRALSRTGWTVSFIFPVVGVPPLVGIGPAGGIAYIPDEQALCASMGVGASVGDNASAGTITQVGGGSSPGALVKTLTGWSATVSGNAPSPDSPVVGPGGQAVFGGGGVAGGVTVGVPGFGASATDGACGKF